jgi:hypothetical protein
MNTDTFTPPLIISRLPSPERRALHDTVRAARDLVSAVCVDIDEMGHEDLRLTEACALLLRAMEALR